MRSRLLSSLSLILLSSFALPAFAEWQPAKGPLMTKWAKDVTPDKVHPEYPRPQLVREKWTNLNGLWDYAIRPADESQPAKFDGQILVPFPIESALSGVMKRVNTVRSGKRPASSVTTGSSSSIDALLTAFFMGFTLTSMTITACFRMTFLSS